MKRQGKNCGAVSVFLTIVLVPCIIVTCAFDDISRVQLSKAGAASAADLALYSLMADYDVNLKDYYGLVASSQSIEEFYEKTASYFSGMMDAKGVSGEGSELFLDYLKGLLQNDRPVSDFLQVEFVEAASVGAAENAQMGENAALLEDGIVEFMKYRGPAAIVKKLLDRFANMDFDQSSTVDKNSEIIEKKKIYADTEEELLNAALYTYIAIYQYEEAWQAGNPLAEKGYSGMCEVLSQIWKDLQKATELITTYYFAQTDQLEKIPFPVYNNVDAYHLKPENVGKAVSVDGRKVYCVNTQILKEILNGMDDEIAAVQDAQKEVESQFPQFTDGENPAVYLLEVQDIFGSSSSLRNIKKNMDKLLKRYALIKAALKCVPFPEGDDLPIDWVKQLDDAGMDIQDLQKTVSDSGKSGYMNCVRAYNSCAGLHYDQIKNKSYTFDSSLTGSAQTLGSFVAQIASRMPELQSELQELIDKLTVVIDGGRVVVNGESKKVISLDKLAKKAADYQNAREKWGASADKYQNETDYAKQESDAYHGNANDSNTKSEEEKISEEMAAKISREAVDELKQRLTNIRTDMKNFLKALDTFTYGKEKVCNIQTADKLVSLGRKAMPPRSSSSLRQNKADAESYFATLVRPQTDEIFRSPSEDRGKNGNHPDLRIATPDLYAYLKSRFEGNNGSKIEAEKKKNDKVNEGYKNEASAEEEDAKNVDYTMLAGKGDDINGGHGGRQATIGTAISSIATLIKNIIDGNIDEMRDQLYVCEYIMDMFSYATINLEGKYKSAQNGSTSPEQGTTQEGQGEDKKVCLSLTNRAIDHDHNKANLGEVEYILYGSPSIDKNLRTSYGNIYVWRIALNTVSGFINFYSGNNETARAIQAVAAAVAAATAGVVPVPVTKCVLIEVLAAMESAHDLNQLKKGAPVLFYKAKDTDWSYAFHASDGSQSGNFTLTNNQGQNDAKGMYYSDYMYLFLMIGLTSQIYPDMLLRTGDLIEANMQMSGDSEFDLSKSLCYFHLKAKLRVKPLMLTLPIVHSIDRVDSSGVLENKDWCTYDVDIYRGYS